MAVGEGFAAPAARSAGRWRPAAALTCGVLLALAAASAPASATSYPAPLFEQTERERFEALVNRADVVCAARLDSSALIGSAPRALFSDPVTWKGDSTLGRFEVRGWDYFGGDPHLDDLAPGARYRLFLQRRLPGGLRVPPDREGPPLYAVVAAGTASDARWWWSYPRATVDTIVARARIDTLYAQATLVVLARPVRREMHDRDGRPVLSRVLRVERVLKGAAPADTIVYQAAEDVRHWDRALLFLKGHGADAWEPVWPGAGVHEFDEENREIRTGEPLQSFLEELDRLAGRAAKH